MKKCVVLLPLNDWSDVIAAICSARSAARHLEDNYFKAEILRKIDEIEEILERGGENET